MQFDGAFAVGDVPLFIDDASAKGVEFERFTAANHSTGFDFAEQEDFLHEARHLVCGAADVEEVP